MGSLSHIKSVAQAKSPICALRFFLHLIYPYERLRRSVLDLFHTGENKKLVFIKYNIEYNLLTHVTQNRQSCIA
jgi:hypothetical protein